MSQFQRRSIQPGQQFSKIIQNCLNSIRNSLISQEQLENTILQFLKDLLTECFGMQKYSELLSNIFETPHLLYNSLNNLCLFLMLDVQKIPIKKIFNLKGKKYTKSEGFHTQDEISSDSEKEITTIKNKIDNELEEQQQKNAIQPDHSNLIQSMKIQIEQLEAKVQEKEKSIMDMTMAYIKDVQHLKQMYNKASDDPLIDIYEAFEPQIINFIEEQIQNANKYYLNRMTEYQKQIRNQQYEISSLQKSIQILIEQQDLQQVIKMVFIMEPDIYKVWRVLQDLIGTETFFQIFEDQRGGYGIDYRKIDQLLSNSQASQRVYQKQKEMMEQQMIELVRRFATEIGALKKQLKSQEKQIVSLTNQLESEIMLAKGEAKTLLEQKYEEKEKFLLKQFENQKKQMILSWAAEDHKILIQKTLSRYALFKWNLYAKFLKLYPIFQIYKLQNGKIPLCELDYYSFDEIRDEILRQLKTGQLPQITEQDIENIEEDYQNIKQQLENSVEMLGEVQLQNQSLNQHIRNLEVRLLKYKHDQAQLEKNFTLMKENLRMMDHTLKLFHKPFNAIISKLGYNININLQDLQQFKIFCTSFDVKEFGEKLRKLDFDEIGNINTLNNIYLKVQMAFNRVNSLSAVQDQFTITEICDLNHPLAYLESIINDEVQQHPKKNNNNPFIFIKIPNQIKPLKRFSEDQQKLNDNETKITFENDSDSSFIDEVNDIIIDEQTSSPTNRKQLPYQKKRRRSVMLMQQPKKSQFEKKIQRKTIIQSNESTQREMKNLKTQMYPAINQNSIRIKDQTLLSIQNQSLPIKKSPKSINNDFKQEQIRKKYKNQSTQTENQLLQKNKLVQTEDGIKIFENKIIDERKKLSFQPQNSQEKIIQIANKNENYLQQNINEEGLSPIGQIKPKEKKRVAKYTAGVYPKLTYLIAKEFINEDIII